MSSWWLVQQYPYLNQAILFTISRVQKKKWRGGGRDRGCMTVASEQRRHGRRATWQRDILNCALAAHLLHVDNPVHPSAFNSIINDRSEVMEIDYFKTNSSRQCCQFSRIDNVQYRRGASDCSNMCCRQLINSPIPSGIITLWCSNKYYNPQSPNKCDA